MEAAFDAAADSVRSLAAVVAGERLTVRRILFGALRALCAELGVKEGDTLTCRAGTATHILLETPSGRTVPLERDWARFIQVTDAVTVPARAAPSAAPRLGMAISPN
jgi:hypothetical protein